MVRYSSEREKEVINDVVPEFPSLSRSAFSELLNGSEVQDKSSKKEGAAMSESESTEEANVGFYLNKALTECSMSPAVAIEAKNINCLQFSKDEVTNDTADYFMLKTRGIGRLKRPSFLDDPLYDDNMNLSSKDEHLNHSSPEIPKAVECVCVGESFPYYLHINVAFIKRMMGCWFISYRCVKLEPIKRKTLCTKVFFVCVYQDV